MRGGMGGLGGSRLCCPSVRCRVGDGTGRDCRQLSRRAIGKAWWVKRRTPKLALIALPPFQPPSCGPAAVSAPAEGSGTPDVAQGRFPEGDPDTQAPGRMQKELWCSHTFPVAPSTLRLTGDLWPCLRRAGYPPPACGGRISEAPGSAVLRLI